MSKILLFLSLLLLSGLSACGVSIIASDELVTKYAYVHDGPPSITLVTVINNNNGEGGHSALLINAQQRIVFDPAGNFKSKFAPERNDFVYGMRPEILDRYISFHARTAWHVILQEKIVSPEVAEHLYQMAKNNGAVPSAFCANSVSHMLKGTPGFESISVNFFPKKIMKDFAKLPGVTTSKFEEWD